MRSISLTLLAATALLAGEARAQIESPVLIFNRGMLWQSVFYGKIGPNFNNWARRGIGLDWPGFDESWVREDIGGAPSHLVTGGFYIGARKTGDTIFAVEDWSMYAGTISTESGVKYKITKHTKKHKNGANYWLQTSPLEGEEVIETVWEHNLNYTNVDDREHQLPLRVTRTMHQWSGSRRDENYIIYEYVLKNISPEIRAVGREVVDTLYGVYLLVNYALHVNSRAWTVLFPSLTPGARNTWMVYDGSRTMMYGFSGDYRETVDDESFMFSGTQGPVINGTPSGEWLAPGLVGVRLLYSSPDSTGRATRVNRFGWSAASNSIDLSGPFTGIGALEAKYQVVSNPAMGSNFVSSPGDTVFMKRSRMWSLMSLGPWRILPGDSIIVALAEMVDGVDYHYAVNPKTDRGVFNGDGAGKGTYILRQTADKAKFTYNQRLVPGRGFNHPDPPAAPAFTVDFYKEKQKFVANVINWKNDTEGQPDPDDGTDDLAGYRLYRSTYLPIGPWDTVATVMRGDPNFFDQVKGLYTYVDSSVQIGANYYYALTAFDTGKANWAIDPTAVFPETGTSRRVPPLESSIFANRMISPFKATLAALGTLDEVLVVPNPFIIREGFAQPGVADEIQFVNLPSPCTIRIYTVRGDLVATINHPEGAGGIASWDQVTDFGQFVESGVYIFHVDSPIGTKIGKFAIIR